MGNGFVCCSLVFVLFVTLAPGAITSNGVEVIRLPNVDDVERKEDHIHGGDSSSSPHMGMMGVSMGLEADLKNPQAKVFAVIKDIEVGNTLPIYFQYVNDPTSVQLLPKETTHDIPLSSKELPQLIRFFSLTPDSPQALAMKQTLAICEMEAPDGEVKGCVTSLESLNDFSRPIFGSESSRVRVLRSSLISKSTPILQNYTVMESKEVSSGKIIPCHNEAYPYAVYYCHFQVGTINKVFEVSLRGENGERVNAVFLCHMDTSKWSAGHIAFHLLGLKPGDSEICHFFPAYDIVVVPYK